MANSMQVDDAARAHRSARGWEEVLDGPAPIEGKPASLPSSQFKAHVEDEIKWLRMAHDKNICRQSDNKNLTDVAEGIILQRWIEQGIWKEEWSPSDSFWLSDDWKHEGSPFLDSDGGPSDSSAEEPPVYRLSLALGWGPVPTRARSEWASRGNDKQLREAERNAIREKHRQASRPYQQFFAQISIELEKINAERNGCAPNFLYAQEAYPHYPDGPWGAEPTDHGTLAHERVKKAWISRGIWNNEWSLIPGWFWLHERPTFGYPRNTSDEGVEEHSPTSSEDGSDECSATSSEERSDTFE
jgi:hypothetical protein